MTPLAAPVEASATPVALAAVTDAALAVQGEATRLLAALAEISTRASIGAIRPHEGSALAAQAANVEPDLRQTGTTLSEIRQRIRLAAGLRRQS